MRVLHSPEQISLSELQMPEPPALFLSGLSQPVVPTVFLAGPTYRVMDRESWRVAAIRLFEKLGFNGVLFVPEPAAGYSWPERDVQIEWEHKYLDWSSWVLFWIPRDMDLLPGLTTNIEWGMYWDSGKANLGYPLGAPHMEYMDWCARKIGVPVRHTLEETVAVAKKGAERWAFEGWGGLPWDGQ